MGDIRLVEWGPDETDRVCDLLRRCFDANPKAHPDVMRWQYWSNRFGRTRMWVALDGDRLVGHHTGYVVPVTLGRRKVMGAIQVDTATDPEYRGRGLYGRLSMALYESLRRDGVAVMLGNPNAAALGPLTRVGWRPVADLRLMVRPLRADWVRRRLAIAGFLAVPATRMLFPPRTVVPATQSRSVPAGLAELSAGMWRGTDCGVVGDVAWWQWRFADHPNKPYAFHEVRDAGVLAAAAVTRLVEDRGDAILQVLDVAAVGAGAAREAIDSAAAAAPEAVAMTMLATSGGLQAIAARHAGFRMVPRSVRRRRTYFGVLPLVDPSIVGRCVWSISGGALDYP